MNTYQVLTVKVPSEVKSCLQEKAECEYTTVSQLVRAYLCRWYQTERRGYET